MNLIQSSDLSGSSDIFLTLDNRVSTIFIYELSKNSACIIRGRFEFRFWSLVVASIIGSGNFFGSCFAQGGRKFLILYLYINSFVDMHCRKACKYRQG
jgi:hypothetical protein